MMMMMMRLLCLLSFASLTAIHAAPDAIANSTCNKCVEMSKVQVAALSDCYDALVKDSAGSESRDLKGLGLLALRRVKENATEAVEIAQRLVDEGGPASIDLDSCKDDFQYVVDEAAGDAKTGFSKADSHAVFDFVYWAREHLKRCEEGLEDHGQTTFNLYFQRERLNDLIDVVDCITTLLFGAETDETIISSVSD